MLYCSGWARLYHVDEAGLSLRGASCLPAFTFPLLQASTIAITSSLESVRFREERLPSPGTSDVHSEHNSHEASGTISFQKSRVQLELRFVLAAVRRQAGQADRLSVGLLYTTHSTCSRSMHDRLESLLSGRASAMNSETSSTQELTVQWTK